MSGVVPGGSGTFNGFEAFGVNTFGKNKAAALSFAKEMAGFDSQKSIALGKDYTALPPSRLSVYEDPEVKSSYPLADMLSQQSKTNIDRWGAPYFNDMSAAFDDILVKMFKKQVTVKDARAQLVTATQKAIDKWKQLLTTVGVSRIRRAIPPGSPAVAVPRHVAESIGRGDRVTLGVGILGSGYMGRTYAFGLKEINHDARLVAVAGGTRAAAAGGRLRRRRRSHARGR